MKFIFTLRIFVLWLDLRKQLRGLVICSLRNVAGIMILTFKASISEHDFFLFLIFSASDLLTHIWSYGSSRTVCMG